MIGHPALRSNAGRGGDFDGEGARVAAERAFRQTPGMSVRNVFDQYDQPENRVTHALMSALDADRNLLDAFLKKNHPRRRVAIHLQMAPEEKA